MVNANHASSNLTLDALHTSMHKEDSLGVHVSENSNSQEIIRQNFRVYVNWIQLWVTPTDQPKSEWEHLKTSNPYLMHNGFVYFKNTLPERNFC